MNSLLSLSKACIFSYKYLLKLTYNGGVNKQKIESVSKKGRVSRSKDM